MIWFLACSAATPWNESAALEPALNRLDADHNHRVDASEFAAVAPQLDFTQLDTNQDGVLSTSELADWMDTSDPLTFDHRFGIPAVSRQQAAALEQTPPEVRMLLDLFTFLDEEMMSAAPEIPRPGAHRRRAAAQTASLSSPESQAVLDALQVGFLEAGLTFPPGLEKP